MSSSLVSTFGVRAKWADELREDLQKRPSTDVLFPFVHDPGNVIVESQREEVREDWATITDNTNSTQQTARWVPTVQKGGIRKPRVQSVKSLPDERYILLKKYEGFVTGRTDRTFMARLFESGNNYPVLEAEFDIEELSESDRDLVIEGAALVWTIGYGCTGTTRKRESVIYMRRLPQWNRAEAEDAFRTIQQITRDISWK